MEYGEALNTLGQKFGHSHFKEKQRGSFRAVAQKKDAVIILPAGYGKSVIFQSIPFFISLLETESFDSNNITIVVTPLHSVIQSQIGNSST